MLSGGPSAPDHASGCPELCPASTAWAALASHIGLGFDTGIAVRARAGNLLVFWTRTADGTDPCSFHSGETLPHDAPQEKWLLRKFKEVPPPIYQHPHYSHRLGLSRDGLQSFPITQLDTMQVPPHVFDDEDALREFVAASRRPWTSQASGSKIRCVF